VRCRAAACCGRCSAGLMVRACSRQGSPAGTSGCRPHAEPASGAGVVRCEPGLLFLLVGPAHTACAPVKIASRFHALTVTPAGGGASASAAPTPMQMARFFMSAPLERVRAGARARSTGARCRTLENAPRAPRARPVRSVLARRHRNLVR
jgi:hypothetical protein